MTRTLAIALSAVVAALVVAPAPAAAVPEQLGLTARVVDAGTPITGSHTVTVRLHTAASGGAPVWTEVQTVAAADGLVYVALGAVTPLTDTIIDGGPLWAELQVDSTVLSPRLAVTSAAYAIRAGVAEDAERLGGQAATAFAAAGHNHAGTYLPVGAALACSGTDKVASINPSTGSVTCAPDASGPTYTAGAGISIVGTAISTQFAGSGVGASAARSDHNHAGIYLPVGTTLSCPAGQFQTAIQPGGSVTCAAPTGDISDVTAGAGLTGGATTGAATLAVAFAGTGAAATAARSDHAHAPVCPTGYVTHPIAATVAPLCIKRVVASATWTQAATACYATHAGGQLCTYTEMVVGATTGPAEILSTGYWLADRVDDNWVLRVNGTNTSDFDEKIEIVTTTVVGPGYYCCARAN